MLTRHSSPGPTESLWGYFLQLTEKNGLPSPGRIAKQAGYTAFGVRSARLSASSLAEITGHRQKLRKIQYYGAPRGYSKILGQRVPCNELLWGASRVCPFCIDEKGIVEAHFDLELMVACPVHRCVLLDRCWNCKQVLKWYRPGMLICVCGADLRKHQNSPKLIDQQSCELLEIIRRRVLKVGTSQAGWSTLPESDLLKLELRQLLFLLRKLGKLWAMKIGCPLAQLSPSRTITYAAAVLTECKRGFLAAWTECDGHVCC